MTAAANHAILRYFRRVLAHGEAAQPDRHFLECYLERRDEAAFATLVQRHGSMVLSVCRAVLHHHHDAEDAFQATFLVLARKASSIRRRENVGSWLHGVAYRVAKKARAAGARRQALEAKWPAAIASADDLSWSEVRTILHAELAALPERFRDPLVLCYLEGLTQEQAARRLAWTAGTVKGRLQRGRDLLRQRLERRGLGLSAALGAVALTGQALAGPVPLTLLHATVRAALPVAGQALSSTVAALAQHALAPLVPATYKAVAAVLLVAVALAAGVAQFSGKPPNGEHKPEVGKPVTRRSGPPTDRYGDPLPDGAIARLGTVRFNHGDDLNSLHFLPDGKTIITEGYESGSGYRSRGAGILRFWDAATGKELRHFRKSKPPRDDQTALTPDGKTMVFLNQEDESDTVRLWDLAQGKEVRVLPLGVRRRVWSVRRRNALAPDGRLCAAHTPQDIRVFDITTGKELYKLANDNDQVQAVVFAGNDHIVMADKKQLITVWQARTGKLIRQFAHGFPVETLVASADGSSLATLEHHTYAIDRLLDKDVVHVWDLRTGTRKHMLPTQPKRWYMEVKFSPDGKTLFARSSGDREFELAIWDLQTGKRVRELPSETLLAVSSDGSRVAVGRNKFDLLDLRTGRRLVSQDDMHMLGASVFLSTEGDRAFTLGYGSISTWNALTSERLNSFDIPPYLGVPPYPVHSPDGRYAVSFDGDYRNIAILIWDVAAGRRLHTIRPPGANLNLSCAFSPDSSLLATGQMEKNGVIRVWEVRSGKEVRSFKETKAGWPGKIIFAQDGKTLFVAGRQVIAYDATSGKELYSWRIKAIEDPQAVKPAAVGGKAVEDDFQFVWRALAVSPDSKMIACIMHGGDHFNPPAQDRIVLFEARTGTVIRRWNDSGLASSSWEELLFSSDGRLLASSDADVLHLWEVATGKKVHTFRGHRAEVGSLAFSGNGRRLASVGHDSTCLIWDLPLALGAAKPLVKVPGDKDIAAWWSDLAGDDARKACAAVWRLADASQASVPFLRERLKPITVAQAKDIARYIHDLASNTFSIREKAFQELRILGLAAAPALRQDLKKEVTLETRRRIERLLENLSNKPLSGEPLRILRALTVLEHADTSDAQRLLHALAAGAPGAWLTEEAKTVSERVRRSKTRH